MSDQIKYIISELSKPPFNKNFTLISFDSLQPEQLLQTLTDVLAEIDPKNKVDVRAEDPEQTIVRIMEMLRVLKYKYEADMSPHMFRQGLIQADKYIIHPILEWLLKNKDDLKKRAYLAQFLVKLEIPPDILGDADIASLYEQYENLIEDFKTVHRNSVTVKKSGYSTLELRTDIEAMEKEKEVVLKKIERMQKKVDVLPKKDEMLEAAHTLRIEREQEKNLENQKHEQQTALKHAEQKLHRLQQQLRELKHAAIGATPEGLIQRLEEEINVNTYIAKQKLPKEIEQRTREVDILNKVSSEPAMGRSDLDALNFKIQTINSDVNQLVEKHLATKNPADDKLAPFRQQAAIISRKKVNTAEQLSELRSKVSSLDEELKEKQGQLQEFAGEAVLGGEEFKRYVNKLRGRSSVYKRHRADLLALKAETGVLTRTLDILLNRKESALQGLTVEEVKRGVAGFHNTKEKLEDVSQTKANIDQEKSQTLEGMNVLIRELNTRIASKKAELAPFIKELRPLRDEHQEVTTEYEAKKKTYDTTAAGLESATSKLEQEVKSLRDEVNECESQCFLLEAQCVIYQAKLDQVAEEIRLYVGSSPGNKKKTLRDQLTALISEKEKLSRQLKEEQQSVKENQTNRSRQVKLWTDLQRLLECKKACLEEARQNAGVVRREQGAETLIL